MPRPIWEYSCSTRSAPILRAALNHRICPCCGKDSPLRQVETASGGDGRRHTENKQVLACRACGWWFAYVETFDSPCFTVPETALHHVHATGAALARYAQFADPTTVRTLRAEVEMHLRRRGTSNDWAAMEDAVAAILAAFGYQVRVTARSKDGGLDAIVDHPARGSVFVQVKHSRNRIGVNTFRELVGTMHLGGAKCGLLVTSSRFTAGARDLVGKSIEVGSPVELVDGERFLAAMNLVTRSAPPTLHDILELAEPNVRIVDREIVL